MTNHQLTSDHLIMYEPRRYRNWVRDDDLVSFQVMVKETDLFIRAQRDLSKETRELVEKYRDELEQYIFRNPQFLTALEPYRVNGAAPPIVKEMAEAAALAGVGPMAAVAGALAERVGRGLLKYSGEVIVENGGDLFISSKKPRKLGIYVGPASKFHQKVGVEIKPSKKGVGVCTSSGTIGHSLSFGKTDACLVISASASVADAWATALGNMVETPSDIERAIDRVKRTPEIKGFLVIIGDSIGCWGEIKLITVRNRRCSRE